MISSARRQAVAALDLDGGDAEAEQAIEPRPGQGLQFLLATAGGRADGGDDAAAARGDLLIAAPLSRCSNSSSREPAKIRCVWLSTRPGRTTLPVASMISASAGSGGRAAVGPNQSMRPSSHDEGAVGDEAEGAHGRAGPAAIAGGGHADELGGIAEDGKHEDPSILRVPGPLPVTILYSPLSAFRLVPLPCFSGSDSPLRPHGGIFLRLTGICWRKDRRSAYSFDCRQSPDIAGNFYGEVFFGAAW